ncbi:MAG: Oxygen sensor histidine kinase NreB [Verrucomicrobiota bacterium]|jgi:signal transduction histidine kinase
MLETSPLSLLSERYLSSLQVYLQQASPASLRAAHDLGDQAVVMGLETLALAGIHERAIEGLELPCSLSAKNDETIARAAIFFTEAITPIESTHRFALEVREDLEQLQGTLDERTLELSDNKHELELEIVERKIAEAEFKSSEELAAQLLTESRIMETHLRDMLRKILSTNEDGRKMMSHQLHDEIAQTLLGIHVRLLKLRKEVEVHDIAASSEIVTIQQVVEQSVNAINQLAHEFGKSP